MFEPARATAWQRAKVGAGKSFAAPANSSGQRANAQRVVSNAHHRRKGNSARSGNSRRSTRFCWVVPQLARIGAQVRRPKVAPKPAKRLRRAQGGWRRSDEARKAEYTNQPLKTESRSAFSSDQPARGAGCQCGIGLPPSKDRLAKSYEIGRCARPATVPVSTISLSTVERPNAHIGRLVAVESPERHAAIASSHSRW